jgi:hypothetical protein
MRGIPILSSSVERVDPGGVADGTVGLVLRTLSPWSIRPARRNVGARRRMEIMMAGPGVAAVCWCGRDMGFPLAKVRETGRWFVISLIRRLRQGQPADSHDGDPALPGGQTARELPQLI